MGTNTIPTAADNTIIPAAHHNALKDAVTEDVVPRSAATTAPLDGGGSIGQSSYRWTLGFIKRLFVGSVADNISIEAQAGDCIIKVGGNERMRISQSVAFTPAGMIMAFAGDADLSTQWLICDGRELSRTTYATLFAAVGVRFGQGNNTTTFNIPDTRGRFLRGRDTAAGNDPGAAVRTAIMVGGATGDAVGSYQADDVGAHDHSGVVAQGSPKNSADSTTSGGGSPVDGCGNNQDASSAMSTGLETRPKNMYVNYLIKT